MEAEARKAEAIAKEENRIQETTFDQLANFFFRYAENARKKSWRRELRRYNSYLKNAIGGKRAVDVSPFDLEKIKLTMQKDRLAPKTVHHALSLARSIFRRAKKAGMYAGEIPTDRIDFPTGFDNRRINWLRYEQAEKLLERLKESSMTTYRQSVLSLDSGMRFKEIANLTWDNIDFDEGLITILDSKNSKTGFVEITERMERALKEIMPRYRHPGQLVFPAKHGGVMRQVSSTFNKICGEMFNKGVTDLRQRIVFHSLRHTFCSWLVLEGVDLYVVKELARHENLEMTERYVHISQSSKKQAIEKVTKARRRAKRESAQKTAEKIREKKQAKNA